VCVCVCVCMCGGGWDDTKFGAKSSRERGLDKNKTFSESVQIFDLLEVFQIFSGFYQRVWST
jgi:hypothetical protein